MEKIFPLISPSATGPLGAWHLPRLWLKILLHATGRLPDGYRHGLGGFDEMTVVNLGIPADEFVRFIESELPTYVQCEAWVRVNAKNLDPASIAKHNETLRTYQKKEENAVKQRAEIGLAGDERGAVLLNDLDDWTCVHAQVTGERAPAPA